MNLTNFLSDTASLASLRAELLNVHLNDTLAGSASTAHRMVVGSNNATPRSEGETAQRGESGGQGIS